MGAATLKDVTRVKPFYEAPQFAQTYSRPPSLVHERPLPPLPPPAMLRRAGPLPQIDVAPALQRVRAELGQNYQLRRS